ncbi:MAG: aminopeptidase P family protein [Acidobacteria bacterium]|nr:aminopeptidase P family protein [Acidobacteriota bacterium]
MKSGNRRHFLKLSALGGAVSLATFSGVSAKSSERGTTSGSPIDKLQNMMADAVPISKEEHFARVAKAQKLMVQNGIRAIFLEGSTNLNYFTGVTWGQSERMTAAVIPAKGEVKYVCPAFEEGRLREKIFMGDDVRVWDEHESPYKRVTQIFADFGIRDGKIGLGERTRFFLYDGIRKEAPGLDYVSADPVTVPCRMYKSPAEIALLQKASDITIAAYKASVKMIEVGMTGSDISAITVKAHAALGVSGGIGAQIDEASSSPHGSIHEPKIHEGSIVLMDGGCGVHGYRSDISRTFVFGAYNKRQKEVWDLEKRAQAAGFGAAKLGDPCENVDIVARKVITDAGYGPGYKTPGLPHRTGHGIGMDGHEWGNMVLNNKTPLAKGMCFSIEPGIAIPGEFGVRLEDCAYMTDEGCRWFSKPSVAIDDPFGDN